MRMLIMGLPGSGKTTLAIELKKLFESAGLTVSWYNADMIRELYNDWDFTEGGRLRQAFRMRQLSHQSKSNIVICDFIAPTNAAQLMYEADRFIWMDTIKKSRYADTNKIFEQPRLYDFRVRKKNAKLWAQIIFDNIIGSVNDTIKIN